MKKPKYFVLYEKDALVTTNSTKIGPFKSLDKAFRKVNSYNAADYDACVVTLINNEWCRLEVMENELFYKPVEKDTEYWMPLAQNYNRNGA
jgi:hypothetical protein